MFIVSCSYPLLCDWEALDAKVKEIAGHRTVFSGTGNGVREHRWELTVFSEALSLRQRLERIDEVEASIHEKVTEVGKVRR